MVTLVILDGFGENKTKFGNAIKSQGTPYLDKLKKMYPHTLIEASGEAVGLPKGVMGNSEVGHLTLGCGRVILQDLKLIDSEIENGKFFKNSSLLKAMTHAEKHKSSLHIMGLMSNGGVHSQLSHLYAILELAKNFDIKNIYIHAIMDGRDTGFRDGEKFIEQIEEKIAGTNAKIATVIGRIYAMDREKRYERVEKAYKMLMEGKGEKTNSAKEAVLGSYENGIYDEYIEPQIIEENAKIQDDDSMIFFNYRSDRAREISFALTDENFKEFNTKKLNNFLFTPMTEYSDKLKHLNTIYPPKVMEDNLASTLSKAGKTQFHIAETTKYAHVTFFFNGGIELPYRGEERKLIDSINVKDFSQYPKMRANEITQDVLEAIASEKYDFILVNYSNPDMIGHTGNFNATKEAIECVDKQAYAVALATLMVGGDCIITADHGNAEEMMDKDGNKLTKHTTNPVPVIFVSDKHKKAKLKKGKSLTAIAPTVLKLLEVEKPEAFDEPLF
ncbi:MAG: 2,3-bisphosphoglycerate-independent phosphoglycerate mutase [Clostridia bacterium]|nr:2,3-bisphosphoglycerate-independent phosphoglycerate mutase [Clostridia bacterium]